MGTRGPLPAKRAKALRTADGQRLRRLPADADAIARRLAHDIPGLEQSDMAMVEVLAMWLAVGKESFRQLQPSPGGENVDELLRLLTTDTAHGNKEESRKSPLLIVLRTASEQILAYAQQLGATPMARARMPQEEAEEQSLADLLFADMATTQAATHG